MFLNSLISLLCIIPGLLLASGCDDSCPANSSTTRCIGGYCINSGSPIFASCDGGYCRCHRSALYDGCSCLPHISGCLIKSSLSTYIGLPSTDGSPESPYYGCVSTATNCEYEVHVIANYESSNGRRGFGTRRVAGDTYVDVNINGQSSKPLILVFTSYEPVNWRLNLPSGVVNRIILGGYYTSKIYSNTYVEVVTQNLYFGYGPGGSTVRSLIYLTKRFGPISSFSGSYRADRWNININRTSSACNSLISTTNDNPKSIVIRFKVDRYSFNENEGHVTVAVLTNGPTVRNITVQYSTIDGTAQAPLDYTAMNETRVIPAGSTQFNITIPIHFDLVDEQSEYFKVHLSLPDEPTVCIPDATVNISNVKNSIPEIIGGVIGGTVVISLALAAVIAVKIIYTRSHARVTIQDNTTLNQSNSTNLSSTYTQPHPPLTPPTTAAFNLSRPEPIEPVVITIGKPQTCPSIT